jgi:P63C domain
MENPESIQSQGGKARAEKLSADKIKAIASKGALARWGAKATHKGNFKAEFGTDVECYVLDDALKTPVISQSGMGEAIGLSVRGNAFPRFLESKAMADSVSAELRRKLSQTIKFQWSPVGAITPPNTVHGYDATLLIDICHAIIAAEPNLTPIQKHVARQAHIILGASAKSGIRNLVYALAGYNPTTQEVIEAFKLYVQEEAKKYEKEFPPELYANWYRLYDIQPIEGRGRPWHFKKLTVNHVYYPLAKSNGKVLELVRASKASGGERKKKLFQFLSEIGTRALRFHLGRLVEMAEDSGSQAEYEAKIRKRFGGEEQQEFELTIPEIPKI